MHHISVGFVAIVGLFTALVFAPTFSFSAEECGKATDSSPVFCGPIDQVEAYDVWINILSIPGIEMTEFLQRTTYVGGGDRLEQKMTVLIEGGWTTHIRLERASFEWPEDSADKSIVEKIIKKWNGSVTSAERLKAKRGWASKATYQRKGNTCFFYKLLTQDQKITGTVSTCKPDVFDNYFKYKFRRSSRAENIAAYGLKSLSRSDIAPKKSYIQRKCVAAEKNTGDLANFIKSLSKDDLVKFLAADQNCNVF